jgi:hypothetical protein
MAFWILFISHVMAVNNSICLNGSVGYISSLGGGYSFDYQECVYPTHLSEVNDLYVGLRERMISSVLTDPVMIAYEFSPQPNDETILILPTIEPVITVQNLNF